MAFEQYPKPAHALRRLSVRHFKGIRSLEVADLPDDARWIFLTGENGYGKTSVLQALASGLADTLEHLSPYLRRTDLPGPDIEVETHRATYGLRLDGLSLRRAEPLTGPLPLACYGSARLDTYTESSRERGMSDATRSLFDSRALLKNIEHQLSRWYFKQEDKEFEQKYRHVSALLQDLLGVRRIDIDPKTDQVLYTEQDPSGQAYEPLPALQLASGYRSIISMIGDMVLRLYDTQPGVSDPKALEGLVIIDELDLHFHPKWQKRLPMLLSRCFPGIQFIASTHSPIPLLGAPEGSVFLRVNRSPEAGITLERLPEIEEMIGTMLPNAILTSPIFGMQDIFPASYEPQHRIRTEDSYDEILVNNYVQDRLAQYEGTPMEQDLLAYLKAQKKLR